MGVKKNGNGNGLSKNAETLLKLLRKEDQSFSKVSVLLNVSKDHVADLADGLCKIGYDVRAYSKDGDDHLTLARSEEIGVEAMPISLTNRKLKIAFIAEPRMGAFQSQISMMHWLYKELFEREQVDCVMLVGGLTIGQPTPTMQPDVFRADPKNPKVLTDYAVKHFPKSLNFKTYIISNQRELASKTKDGINLIKTIASAREDLSHAGDLERTFSFRGVRIKVMSPWDDNSPKGASYGLQKIVDSIADETPPHIIVAGGAHKRSEIPDYGEHGIYVYGLPSLHTQMRRQFRKGVRPRLGCLILELEFNKDWSFDINKGLRAHHINLDAYAQKNDCLVGMADFANAKISTAPRRVLEWFINERTIREGELSRRLNKSKEFIRRLIKLLEKRLKIRIPFSSDSKCYEFPKLEKNSFSPLPLKYDEVFHFLTKVSGDACTHLGSNHDLPDVLNQAHKDAARLGSRRNFCAGDVTEGPAASGYRGHQNDVKFPGTDDLEDYAVAKWPRVKIKADPKRPLMQTRMKTDENGRPVYEEYFVKDGEVWLQTDIIDGNHDCWAKQQIGHRPVRALALRIPELLRYLGPNDGKISMDGAVVFEGVYNRLTHGDGGLGYTLSMKLQKHLASHKRRGASRGMPTVLWFGNWHVGYILFEDELGIMLPCFKSEDEFHLRKDLVSWVGMYVVELYGDGKGHLTRVATDYLNYRHLAVVNK